ncbi:MAG: DNA repair protein RadC [Alphaproteobacteria bacterium]
MKEDKSVPHYLGHRQRLKEKLIKQGSASLADYELLELILMLAIPRKDVKPLAKELIEKFGSFGNVITADNGELLGVSGIKETGLAAFKIIEAAAIKMLLDETSKKPIIDSWDKLQDYCKIAMSYNKIEQFRIFFLDIKNRLIADELQQKGTVNHTPVYPREVVKRALELGASSIIMAHNHPSGDASPSQADIMVTKKVSETANAVGITLIDHIIVTKESCFSFREKKMIK